MCNRYDMKLKTWLETDAGLTTQFPQMQVNRGSSTPASDPVLRTGLQPQVDSEDIHTDQKDEQDKIQAIDGALQRADSEMPQGRQGSRKLSKFQKMWGTLKEKWEELKIDKSSDDVVDTNGLGSVQGDEEMLQYMQQNPNSVPPSI